MGGTGARLGVETSLRGLWSRAQDLAGAGAEAVCNFAANQLGHLLWVVMPIAANPRVFFHRYRDGIRSPNRLQHQAVS